MRTYSLLQEIRQIVFSYNKQLLKSLDTSLSEDSPQKITVRASPYLRLISAENLENIEESEGRQDSEEL